MIHNDALMLINKINLELEVGKVLHEVAFGLNLDIIALYFTPKDETLYIDCVYKHSPKVYTFPVDVRMIYIWNIMLEQQERKK